MTVTRSYCWPTTHPEGGIDDLSTPPVYSLFDGKTTQCLDVKTKKTISVAGNTYECYLKSKSTRRTWVHGKDSYEADSDSVFIDLDSKTGKLLRYSVVQDGVNPAYEAEVNKYSSEEEFTAYAKKMMVPYDSTEDCEVEVRTTLMKHIDRFDCYNTDRTVEGYVREENYPQAYAEYTFTFYKTFAGVRRYDTSSITIKNTGEISDIHVETGDELYEPFADSDIPIDMEQAKNLAKEAVKKALEKEQISSKDRDGNDSFTIAYEPYTVATNDGELWLLLGTVVRSQIEGLGGFSSRYDYCFKLAELTDSANENETDSFVTAESASMP